MKVKDGIRDGGIVLQGTGNSATRSYGTRDRKTKRIERKKKSTQIIADNKQEVDL